MSGASKQASPECYASSFFLVSPKCSLALNQSGPTSKRNDRSLTHLHSDSGHSKNWTKIFHCPTSSGASERASAAERASPASSAERANERADERVAQ